MGERRRVAMLEQAPAHIAPRRLGRGVHPMTSRFSGGLGTLPESPPAAQLGLLSLVKGHFWGCPRVSLKYRQWPHPLRPRGT